MEVFPNQMRFLNCLAIDHLYLMGGVGHAPAGEVLPSLVKGHNFLSALTP
ncbi:hypothetical protein [Desulfopila sp. IMCC35006]|nr:hypothetical protein [Desulfopila sp. IMCC35006]